MATNWVIDLFDLVQEEGGNILTEDDLYLCLQEFQSSVWAKDTSSGNG